MAYAVDALGELLERFNDLEKRYLGVFGIEKESEGDILSFQTDQMARIIYHDKAEH